jgi:Flp pilus assembly protein TadG
MRTEDKSKQADTQQGQTLVEFAFVIIFLLLVLFGIIDFARLFFAYATMANGAREGARFGIISPPASAESGTLECDDETIINHAHDMMVLIGAEADVEVLCPGRDDGTDVGCTTPHECRIQVVVTSNFDMWTPVLPSMNLEAQATMHFE